MLSRFGRGRILRSIVAATGAAALLATSACTIDGDNDTDTDTTPAAQAEDSDSDADDAVELTTNVEDDDTDVKVDEPIIVQDSEGIDSVSLTDGMGTEVEGSFNDDETEWTSDGKLDYSTTYSLEATGGDESLSTSFTTFSPAAVTNGALSPLPESTVGVGQSIAMRFDAVPQDRQAVQDAITVTTEPQVEGAFYWISAQEVRWRPEEYWAPGTEVTVDADLVGTDLGGMYGQVDRSSSFTIGDDVRAVADDATKTVTVTRNGETVKTMPTSMGMPGFETPEGIFQIGDQLDAMTMDSTTYGLALDAGGYVTDVQYATQMSYSGIYFHAAPWSVWAQGNTNTSHGCLNLSVEDAQWVYENLKRGDIAEVKGTGGPAQTVNDGLGDWNIPWDEWEAGNADV
ncbi:MAG: Ig-like domain-containing protein [Corynebacterium sp.]|uniref:L,D-transpeptidase n=1 Tax=Corynebacterium TaxID=1716 RepID=UPI0026490B7B|nr:Ig-like domain-containing protein [Corynebacterium sp.]MDN5722631.1 Ig-like domain-containing protein [Corynebacterium sp.]MDN6282849.1 Ig-like domain-containing protein [Corynebacterium sp.]MDN6305617.1 Ig-like domain-containing protein [Corynebacterium sp.]MDN6353269.1 Ig-like domain-containing protein [Corynebacterium sp.]MDN6368402.1 Ig-like domain-containing protein [Corynebacterium sp.]